MRDKGKRMRSFTQRVGLEVKISARKIRAFDRIRMTGEIYIVWDSKIRRTFAKI